VHEAIPEPKGHPRGMGRGLSAILPRSREDEQGMREIPLELIAPNPAQPRRDFDPDALLALAESIRSRGVLQPVVVRPLAVGRFELIAGERRLRAAAMAEVETLPAVVRPTEDTERLDLALAENMARVDLNPVEEARACAMLVEDLGLTKEEDHERRKLLAREARDHGWSVRETEAEARGGAAPERPGRPEPVPVHPDLADALAAAEDALTAALGHDVRVRARGDGARAELVFSSPGEAVALAEKLLDRGASHAA
jgi:ParB family chromosome partitioning protein